jgi:hypothetical protein
MKCQNPTCSNELPVKKGWASMTKSYCSVPCYRASKTFKEMGKHEGLAKGRDINIGKGK